MDRGYPGRSNSYNYRNQMDRGYSGMSPPSYNYQQYRPQVDNYMDFHPRQQMNPPTPIQPKPPDDLPIELMPKLVSHQILVNPPIEITPVPSEIVNSYWDS